MSVLQKMGGLFSRIIFQNISALMALGMLRVLFSPIGWFPNVRIYEMIHLITQMLVPTLFAYTGGKMFGGHRGGVIATVAVFGTIGNTPADMSVIFPAIVLSLLIGVLIKRVDCWLEDRIPAGFELLFYNAAAGIVGVASVLAGYFIVAPLFVEAMSFLYIETENLVQSGYLPLLALLIEPGKVLFFNNIINHGILEPLGIQQVKELGKSIFFLLETNPGPGLGLLLAIYLHTKREERGNIRSSILIQSLGGIHEVYFPHALMKPWLMLPLVLGGLAGNFVFYSLQAGLVATPSPGSLFVLLAMAPKGQHIAVLIGVVVACLTSFLGSAYVLATKYKEEQVEEERGKPVVEPKTMNIKNIVFACDAGMGSSALGAALLRKQVKKKGLLVEVLNTSVDEIPEEMDVVISHTRLTERARNNAPWAEHYSIQSFVDEAFYKEFIEMLEPRCLKIQEEKLTVEESVEVSAIEAIQVIGEQSSYTMKNLPRNAVVLNCQANDKWQAIQQAGTVLVQAGYVEEGYIEEMYERELSFSTYLANGVALPHGLDIRSPYIKRTGVALLQYPDGIEFENGDKVYLMLAVAAQRTEQLGMLSYLASIVSSEYTVDCLVQARTYEEVMDIIFINDLQEKEVTT